MKFMLLVYVDPDLVDALPEGEMDGMLRTCFDHVDELQRDGRLIESQMLESPRAARSVRIRNDRVTATDGPFSEAKEVLGGYWLLQVRSRDEALAWGSRVPLNDGEMIELRQVYEMTEFSDEAQALAAPVSDAMSRTP